MILKNLDPHVEGYVLWIATTLLVLGIFYAFNKACDWIDGKLK